MKLKKIALIGGAVTLALSAMAVAACSSSSPTVVPPGADSGPAPAGDSGPVTTPSDSGPGNTTDSGPGNTTDSGPAGDSGPSCGSTPTLHPTAAGTVFCGYDDAGTLDCLADSGTQQQCCLGGKVGSGYAPQVCGAFGTACTNGMNAIAIECGQISDCTANGKAGAACCLQGVTGSPALAAGCTYYKEQGGTAVTCEEADGGSAEAGGGGAPACATGEVQICAADSDCPTGQTCTPMKWKLYQVGFCK